MDVWPPLSETNKHSCSQWLPLHSCGLPDFPVFCTSGSAEKAVSFFLLSLFHAPNLTLNIFSFVAVNVCPLAGFCLLRVAKLVLSQNKHAVLCRRCLPPTIFTGSTEQQTDLGFTFSSVSCEGDFSGPLEMGRPFFPVA